LHVFALEGIMLSQNFCDNVFQHFLQNLHFKNYLIEILYVKCYVSYYLTIQYNHDACTIQQILRMAIHWSEAAWEFISSFLGASSSLLTSDFKLIEFMILWRPYSSLQQRLWQSLLPSSFLMGHLNIYELSEQFTLLCELSEHSTLLYEQSTLLSEQSTLSSEQSTLPSEQSTLPSEQSTLLLNV
jgi:hypothetical protein